MTTLTMQEITQFWIRVYFGTTNPQDLRLATIDRAYRDFNRTMHGIRNVQNEQSYKNLRNFINKIVSQVINEKFNQTEFDNWHKLQCSRLKEEFYSELKYNITYGQAQKWINMTLKYLFAIGRDIIPNIDRNYSFFHIPLDNIIQDKLVGMNIPRIPTSWSRIDNYDVYMEYQLLVRRTFSGQIPMDVEFRLFNE